MKSTPAYILRLALTLLIITSLVAAALAGVNAVTAPIIAGLTAEKTQVAVEKVLPGGGEKLDAFEDTTGLVNAVYVSDAGYAIEVAPSGFNGAITMMVGVSPEGKVLGIDIISHAETPSLGAVAADKGSAGQSFRDSFVGLSGQLSVADIDAITGATITSRAVTQGVNAALACAANLSKEAA